MNFVTLLSIFIVTFLIYATFLHSSQKETYFRSSRRPAQMLLPSLESVDISARNYPQPQMENENANFETVAIVGTSDIHGRILPKQYFTLDTNESYEVGGLLYFSSYLKILKEEWKDNLIWLDGGDQYQGTIESNELSGEAIVESLNYQNVSQYFTAAIGNHEFDFGVENLTKRFEQAKYDYINSNILNANTNMREVFSKTKPNKIFKAGSLHIGIFAMATLLTPATTATNVSQYKFEDYLKIAETESALLRKEGADIVLLVAHIGTRCFNKGEDEDILRNEVRFENTTQASGCTESDELKEFLQMLPDGLIDGVIGGHTHNVVHHWINKIPVIQSGANNRYFNILYIKYDKKAKQLIKQETRIEGPVPICEKIFDLSNRCEIESGNTKAEGRLSQFSFHKRQIAKDTGLYEHLKPYMKSAEEYKGRVYGFVENHMYISRTEESALGNFVADYIKLKADAEVSLINNGLIRVGWPKGKLNLYQVYETLPFENSIVSCDMTGEELEKTIKIMQSGIKSFYSTAGIKQLVKTNPKKLLNVSLYDGTDIIRDKTYRVATVDFLLNGGDDFKNVRLFYVPRNVKVHGKLRDQIGDYIASVGRLNTIRDPLIKKESPRLSIINEKKRSAYCF